MRSTPHRLDEPHVPLRRGLWDSVLLALVWRYVAHSVMVLMNLLNEPVAAPTLHDRVLAVTPFVPAVAAYNYHIWLACYVPVAVWLWRTDRPRMVEFLYAGGVLSLARGVCIWLTILGPVSGHDVNVGRPFSELLDAWLRIINPLSALTTDAARVYLTKDLYFSGHTASTFLLLLYCFRYPALRRVAAAAHGVVVLTVLLSHLHYAIDVVGGWTAAFCVFSAANWAFGRLGARAAGRGLPRQRGFDREQGIP